ncbi:hypothetical protein [Curtobacterium oceanosedimentum]|uniref:hypothetical protein n=1 Tax=Curtobacterium oceanosedimentum TaxID=465820 RepID=UPI00339B4E1B
MGRSRGRERGRVVDELRRDLAAATADRQSDPPAIDWHLAPNRTVISETTTVRTLTADDIDAVVSFRTGGTPGQRDMHLQTVGRLVGIRPVSDATRTAAAVDLIVRQGLTQATLRVALGEPITIRRTP